MGNEKINRTGLLASDMDGTVMPHAMDDEEAAFISTFRSLLKQHYEICLAYITGRHLDLAIEGTRSCKLPMPDIFVCDVGTSLYTKEGDQWAVDQQYRQLMLDSWKGRTGKDVAELLRVIPELEPQEAEKQQEFKQSYYVDAGTAGEAVVKRIRQCLLDEQLDANIIFSVDIYHKKGLIDILPPGAAKDYSLAYLQRKLELTDDRIVYAGDSGNDFLAFVSRYPAIVVNNTTASVKEEVQKEVETRKIADTVYFAAGNHVSGVMEGCRHFKLFE